jgi:aldose 1-epimerase
VTINSFGRSDGVEIFEILLRGEGGIEAKVITWGAVLRDLVVPARAGPQRVVLGLNSLEDYVSHSPYFGAVVGRYANRIGGSRFTLEGREIRVEPNENGNALHGGPAGFGVRPWALVAHDRSSVLLALDSPDGDMGYPGRVLATCRYELLAPATLRVTLEATADRPTPVNLTTHGYWNLDGSADIRDHLLRIDADHVTPTNGALIPTGAVQPVAGTPYDFRDGRSLRGRRAGRGLRHEFRAEPPKRGSGQPRAGRDLAVGPERDRARALDHRTRAPVL